MGLAASDMPTAADELQDRLLRPAAAGRRARSWTSRTTTRWSTYGQTGRVLLTTLTKEFFVPRFAERDEGEREQPCGEVPVGRRQRRAAVPRDRGDDDGRGVLKSTTLPLRQRIAMPAIARQPASIQETIR